MPLSRRLVPAPRRLLQTTSVALLVRVFTPLLVITWLASCAAAGSEDDHDAVGASAVTLDSMAQAPSLSQSAASSTMPAHNAASAVGESRDRSSSAADAPAAAVPEADAPAAAALGAAAAGAAAAGAPPPGALAAPVTQYDLGPGGDRGHDRVRPAPGVPIPPPRDDSWRWRGGYPPPSLGSEGYAQTADNPFTEVNSEPLSTFSVDVDTASYANVRRFLMQGQLPPPDSVRIEEMVNYFDYEYPEPRGDHPFAVAVDSMPAPWEPEHRLVRVGVQGAHMHRRERPPANLVFLIDVSGSMADDNKLPLLKRSLAMLVEELGEDDRVSVVTYAGDSGLALEPTSGADKRTILRLIESLESGGSTHGSAGITTAYDVAHWSHDEDAFSRVILCTDGDFNVGITDQSTLERLITDEAERGVFLTVLGFGMGNLKDDTLELLADKGNGNYAYIDTPSEANKVLVEELTSTLVTIAKDVKIQVEFNPRHVGAYRLIGYENRMLAVEDFENDAKDAGEVGAGHNVTALYELAPPGQGWGKGPDLRYQDTDAPESVRTRFNDELMLVKVRYKEPGGSDSTEVVQPVPVRTGADESGDLRFAAAVAAFGMLLRQSPYAGSASLDMVMDLAKVGGRDRYGYRAEFLDMVRIAQRTVERGW